MSIQTPVVSKEEAIVALWEAREQLEAEALQNNSTKSDTQSVPPDTSIHDVVEKVKSNEPTARNDQIKNTSTGSTGNAAPNLMSPEVTKGLERLLNEWPYFKGSGILGFGPGGLQHPTFKRLADIPVRYVLTGRFDDPDQDLIGEIREYVAGWRREQKIEPREDETFEQYLRRVIAAILDARAEIDARTDTPKS